MDTLCLKAGFYGVVTPQIAVPDVRTKPPRVTAAVGRSTAAVNGMSVAAPRRMTLDRESFSRLLRRVSLADARLYSRMSCLGNLAYAIPQIKPGNLLKHHGLRFVTSSIEKRELAVKVEKVEVQDEEVKEADKVEVEDEVKEDEELKVQAEAKEVEETIEENKGIHLSPYAAYQVAATAASFLHSRTKSILPFTSTQSEASKELNEGHSGSLSDDIHIMGNEVASFMATTDSVTAVVAAKEEVKQAVAMI